MMITTMKAMIRYVIFKMLTVLLIAILSVVPRTYFDVSCSSSKNVFSAIVTKTSFVLRGSYKETMFG